MQGRERKTADSRPSPINTTQNLNPKGAAAGCIIQAVGSSLFPPSLQLWQLRIHQRSGIFTCPCAGAEDWEEQKRATAQLLPFFSAIKYPSATGPCLLGYECWEQYSVLSLLINLFLPPRGISQPTPKQKSQYVFRH